MDWSIPLPEAGRQAGASQSWKERGKLGPIPYQTVRRLAVTNQVFLGSWTVDIHQEGQSQRARGKLGPRDSILYQTVNRLLIANQVFLGS